MDKDDSPRNNSGFDQEDDSNYSEPQTPPESPVRNATSQMSLPKPIPIAQKPYSLEPDMIFGWTPKLHFNGPIKLTFTHSLVDAVVAHFLPTPQLAYLGFRPSDSIRLHKQFSHNYHFRFEHLLANQKMAHLMPLLAKDQPSRAFTGMNPRYQGPTLFDSVFEGGNLDAAIEVAPHEFDLFMRVDSNTKGHFSWYNFKLTGQGTVRLNIVNFTKPKSLYNRGMRPYVCHNG